MHVMGPRFASVPAPVFVTLTVTDPGVVPEPASLDVKLTVLALTVSVGWSMMRLT